LELKTREDELYVRYLLGELAEDECARLEEEYFTDDAAFERFLAVKDELTDAYARGELAGAERARFEEHFLATRARRQRVEESRELIQFTTNAAARAEASAQEGPARSPSVAHPASPSWWRSLLAGAPSPAWRYALAAALLIAALGGAWALVRLWSRGPAEQARTDANQSAPTNTDATPGGTVSTSPSPDAGAPDRTGEAGAPETLGPRAPESVERTPSPEGAPPNRRPRPPAPTQIASILLSPVLVRAPGQSNILELPKGTDAVRLRLAFTGRDFTRYNVVLHTVDGVRVWSRVGLRAHPHTPGRVVEVLIPPSVLSRKDYLITLNGVGARGETQEVEEYFFTVERPEAP
jgi:hypothetical protein